MTNSTPWSLEKELARLTGVSNLEDALRALHIIPDDVCGPISVQRDQDWKRGGAETYLYRFWISASPTFERGVVLKACTPSFGGAKPEVVLSQWIERRNLIRQCGGITPILYAEGNGIIVEELLPYSLKQAVLAASTAEKSSLLMGVADYFSILLSQGFTPIAPNRDLFSHGLDVVPVDFGQDLGNPRQSVDAGVFSGVSSSNVGGRICRFIL